MKNVLYACASLNWYGPDAIKQINLKCGVDNAYVLIGRPEERGEYEGEFKCLLRNECLQGHYDEYYSKYIDKVQALDDEILDKLYPYFLEFLLENMRFEKDARFRISDTLTNHYELVMNHLVFWYSFLIDNHIDTVIFSGSTHEGYDHVIFRLCSQMGINTIFTPLTHVFINRVFPMRDYSQVDVLYNSMKQQVIDEYEGVDEITFVEDVQAPYDRMNTKKYETMKKDYVEGNSTDSKFDWRFGVKSKQEYLERKRVQRFVEEKKTHRTTIAKIKSYAAVIDELKNRKQWIEDVEYKEKVYADTLDFLAQYDSLAVDACEDDKFVFFAFHFLPEATSLPEGDRLYCDQVIPINVIAEAIPDDWYVYVKIHPAQLAQVCTISMFEKMDKNPKVKIISRREDSHWLTQHSQAVATLTGSIAWEAQFLQKPILVFGTSIARYAPWSYYVRTIDECKKAISDIIDGNTIRTERDVALFAKIVERLSFVRNNEELVDNLVKYIKAEGL